MSKDGSKLTNEEKQQDSQHSLFLNHARGHISMNSHDRGSHSHDHGHNEHVHHHAEQNDSHGHDADSRISEDVRAAEKVINAFYYYSRYGRDKIMNIAKQMNKLRPEHQKLLNYPNNAHFKHILTCIAENERVIRKLVPLGIEMFGDELAQALQITQLRRPDAEYMTKVLSIFRQLVREWTEEGKPDRDATFIPIIEELKSRFPDVDSRHDIKILCPGAGLGRLPYELVLENFSVLGNECSLFMLLFSSYILNHSKKTNEFTVYPYLFDKSNSWSYDDQKRGVAFPDMCPFLMNEERKDKQRKNFFGMTAGNFLDTTRPDTNVWECVVTAWFLDTANNILDYLDTIYRILKPGGVWINVGPLTYHFEDVPDEASIEIPYSELMRIIKEMGFIIERETTIESNYTNNCRSMLRSVYSCAFFVVVKPELKKEI